MPSSTTRTGAESSFSEKMRRLPRDWLLPFCMDYMFYAVFIVVLSTGIQVLDWHFNAEYIQAALFEQEELVRSAVLLEKNVGILAMETTLSLIHI